MFLQIISIRVFAGKKLKFGNPEFTWGILAFISSIKLKTFCASTVYLSVSKVT